MEDGGEVSPAATCVPGTKIVLDYLVSSAFKTDATPEFSRVKHRVGLDLPYLPRGGNRTVWHLSPGD